MILLIMTSYISVVKIIIFLIDKALMKIKYYRELVFCFFRLSLYLHIKIIRDEEAILY